MHDASQVVGCVLIENGGTPDVFIEIVFLQSVSIANLARDYQANILCRFECWHN